jgi:hypothetical protein
MTWETANPLNSCGTLEASPLTCQISTCAPPDSAGYLPKYRPLWPAIPNSIWKQPPLAQIASQRSQTRRSPASTRPADNAELPKRIDELVRQVGALHVERNRSPPYRDHIGHDSPSRIPPPAPQCAAPPEGHRPGTTLQLSAGLTAASDTRRRIVPSPAPTTNGGTRLHYENLPPLHHVGVTNVESRTPHTEYTWYRFQLARRIEPVQTPKAGKISKAQVPLRKHKQIVSQV